MFETEGALFVPEPSGTFFDPVDGASPFGSPLPFTAFPAKVKLAVPDPEVGAVQSSVQDL